MAKAKEHNDTGIDFIDLIIERPITFNVGDRMFYIHPASLGRTLICSQLLRGLSVNPDTIAANISFEGLRLASLYPDRVCELIAVCTLDKREELFDRNLIKQRAEFFRKHLDTKEMSTLFIMAFNDSGLTEIKHYLGLDAEEAQRERISRHKQSDNSFVSFGARSTLGSLVYPACKDMGLSPRQAIWDISFALLRMLQADAPVSIYLSADERKSLHISDDNTVINCDDESAWSKISQMDWD